jgi:hypothetical protein
MRRCYDLLFWIQREQASTADPKRFVDCFTPAFTS